MKFALVGNIKTEAHKGAKGICPSCGSELIARCGEVKVNHWAHKGTRNCDGWWENETQWHRSWKGQFPKEWQEVIHKAVDGEKHIADVKTEQGWVIEFQHSYLKPEERRSRDEFYLKLVWVVNGLRRQRDEKQFQNIMEESNVIHQNPPLFKVSWPDDSRILTEWSESSSLVFFDFQRPYLWLLLPIRSKSIAYLMKITRENFINYHKDDRFEEFYDNQIQPIRKQLISHHQKRRSYTPHRPILSNRELRHRNRRF